MKTLNGHDVFEANRRQKDSKRFSPPSPHGEGGEDRGSDVSAAASASLKTSPKTSLHIDQCRTSGQQTSNQPTAAAPARHVSWGRLRASPLRLHEDLKAPEQARTLVLFLFFGWGVDLSTKQRSHGRC